jgi:hypothetical protein
MWSAARHRLAAVYPSGELTESESGSRLLMRESDYYDKSRSVQTRVTKENVAESDDRIVIEIDYDMNGGRRQGRRGCCASITT